MNPFLKAFRRIGWKLGLLKNPVLIKFFEIEDRVARARDDEADFLKGGYIPQDYMRRLQDPKVSQEERKILGEAIAEYMLDKRQPQDESKLQYDNKLRVIGSTSVAFLRRAGARLQDVIRRDAVLDAYVMNTKAAEEVRNYGREIGLRLDPIQLLLAMNADHKPGDKGGRDLTKIFQEVLKEHYPRGLNSQDKQALNDALFGAGVSSAKQMALLTRVRNYEKSLPKLSRALAPDHSPTWLKPGSRRSP